jgi:hypothetical protein
MDWSTYELDFTQEGRRKVNAFSYLLGYSRRQYVCFTERQDFDTTLRQHIQAFQHLGVVAATCLYDNMKVVVTRWEDDQPIYNTRFLAFATHYGYQPWACQIRRPQTKGKVERPFHYIEHNLLNGRTFRSLEHLNEVARWWSTAATSRPPASIVSGAWRGAFSKRNSPRRPASSRSTGRSTPQRFPRRRCWIAWSIARSYRSSRGSRTASTAPNRSKSRAESQPAPNAPRRPFFHMPSVDYLWLRRHLSIQDLLRRMHWTSVERRGDQHRGPCPFCAPTSQGGPSWRRCFSVNFARNIFRCFHCQRQGNTLDLWACHQQLPLHEAASQLLRMLDPQPSNRETPPGQPPN